MIYFLSGDIGGTKTLLQICTKEKSVPIFQKSYSSAAYENLETILEIFLAEAKIKVIDVACFALAGPVSGRVIALTNLPWVVDGDALEKQFHIKKVILINDFEAAGYGISRIQKQDLLALQAGVEVSNGLALVVGAGTGLGVAFITTQNESCWVHPSEGGHVDFSPQDETQYALMKYLQLRYGHVSYERIVSGFGLVSIFEFLRDSNLASPSADLLRAMEAGDPAAALAQFSEQDSEPIARQTLDLFLSIYGAFVGNLALVTLPRAGIYIAGGIAAKISKKMSNGIFMQSFASKGRFRELLNNLPLHIVLNEELGLMGAHVIALRHA